MYGNMNVKFLRNVCTLLAHTQHHTQPTQTSYRQSLQRIFPVFIRQLFEADTGIV